MNRQESGRGRDNNITLEDSRKNILAICSVPSGEKCASAEIPETGIGELGLRVTEAALPVVGHVPTDLLLPLVED